jgi:mRNA-degrading endonuclease RelE of RelBE toxin-antitoxin system
LIYQIFDERIVVRVIHIAHRRDVYRWRDPVEFRFNV